MTQSSDNVTVALNCFSFTIMSEYLPSKYRAKLLTINGVGLLLRDFFGKKCVTSALSSSFSALTFCWCSLYDAINDHFNLLKLRTVDKPKLTTGQKMSVSNSYRL